MEQPPLPEDIRRFVLTHIPSVPFLEALLLLRAQPACRWTAEEVAERLYIRDKGAHTLLEDLCKAGMTEQGNASSTDGYCYQPVSADMRAMIDRLADVYAKQLVEVTILIHTRARSQGPAIRRRFQMAKGYLSGPDHRHPLHPLTALASPGCCSRATTEPPLHYLIRPLAYGLIRWAIS